MDTLQYNPTGGQASRDSSNSGHDDPRGVSPSVQYGSYGSTAGLVDREYPPAGAGYRGREKRS